MGSLFAFHTVESTYRLVGAVGEDRARADQEADVKALLICVIREKSISLDQLSRTTSITPLRVNRAVERLRDSDVLEAHGTPSAPFMFERVRATANTRRFAREHGFLEDSPSSTAG